MPDLKRLKCAVLLRRQEPSSDASTGLQPSQEQDCAMSQHGFTPLRRSAEHGFTLVELMVVIVIIGLLATIVAINVIPATDTAREIGRASCRERVCQDV